MFTAIIPVHNRAELLRDLLDSIARQTIGFAEIIVVDNASTDGAAELALERGCRLIAMHENAGFARAVNRGWRSASTEWVAILNSDVELDERWLERLCAAAGEASFAAGMILDAARRDTIDGTYDLVSRGVCAFRAGHGEKAAPAMRARIAIAPATACLFRRDVLERLQGFDERFGSYLEDVDLGLRCLRAGLSGVFEPGAIAYHHGSATFGRWSPRVVRLISRNQLLLVARHYDWNLLRSCWWPIIAGQVLWGLVALRHGRPLSWIAGKIDGLRTFHLEGQPCPALREFLINSEREIRRRASGPYWRWYFRLTRPELKSAAH